MSKVHPVTDVKFAFYCPGCKGSHWFKVDKEEPCWKWNGSFSKPTVTPSILVSPETEFQCHLIIKNGQLHFLDDSYHEFRGEVVDMEEWE